MSEEKPYIDPTSDFNEEGLRVSATFFAGVNGLIWRYNSGPGCGASWYGDGDTSPFYKEFIFNRFTLNQFTE